jgi:hypothetical protein
MDTAGGFDEGTARSPSGPGRRDAGAWASLGDSGLVFTSSVGTVIEPRNLTRFFNEQIAKAGIRRIRFHDLRRTCASMLLAQGVPARVVMDVLGHSQLDHHNRPLLTRDAHCSTRGRGCDGPASRAPRMNALLSTLLSNCLSRRFTRPLDEISNCAG